MSADAVIAVTVIKDGEQKVFNSWRVTRVERKTKGELSSYVVTFRCDEARYTGGEQVDIAVIPKNGTDTETYTFKYKTESGFLGVISYTRAAEDEPSQEVTSDPVTP